MSQPTGYGWPSTGGAAPPAPPAPPAGPADPAGPGYPQPFVRSRPPQRSAGLVIALVMLAITVIGGVVAIINLTSDTSAAAPNIRPPTTVDDNTLVTIPTGGTTTTGTGQPRPTDDSIPPAPSGEALEVGLGIDILVPDGWEIGETSDDRVVLGTDGASLRMTAVTVDDGTTAETLINELLIDVLPDEVQNIKLVHTEPVPVPEVESIASGHGGVYTGVLATNQGSTPVDGTLFAFVSDDGRAIVMDTLNRRGDLDSFRDDFDAILGSALPDL